LPNIVEKPPKKSGTCLKLLIWSQDRVRPGPQTAG
jgi:hypothetical protein